MKNEGNKPYPCKLFQIEESLGSDMQPMPIPHNFDFVHFRYYAVVFGRAMYVLCSFSAN